MIARRLLPVLLTSLLAILAVVPAAGAPPDKFTTRTTRVFLSAFVPEAGVFVDLFGNGDGTYTCA